MRLIPAIDLKDGKCVRLLHGDFDKQTEYSADPIQLAQDYSNLQVADLHVVDLDGAKSGEARNSPIVEQMASRCGLDIQLGGGIRSAEDVRHWLDIGVARCVVGSVAIQAPQEVQRWASEFGPERIVLALDIKLDDDATPMLTTHGWTRDTATSLWACLDSYLASGIRQVLCTDVGRDGAMCGPNVELYVQILQRYPELDLQASGGVRHLQDLCELRRLNIPAAITGRALLDNKISKQEVISFQQNA